MRSQEMRNELHVKQRLEDPLRGMTLSDFMHFCAEETDSHLVRESSLKNDLSYAPRTDSAFTCGSDYRVRERADELNERDARALAA